MSAFEPVLTRIVGIREKASLISEEEIRAIVEEVEDQIENDGRVVFSSTITPEGPQEAIIDTVILLLSGFGVIILLLSGFLVVNAISALITQQLKQIGVMKLIGARSRQIMGMYLSEQIGPQSTTDPLFYLSVTARQDLFDRMLSVTLQARNLLETAYYNVASVGTNFANSFVVKPEVPVVNLTLTWNFNNYQPTRRRDGEVDVNVGI